MGSHRMVVVGELICHVPGEAQSQRGFPSDRHAIWAALRTALAGPDVPIGGPDVLIGAVATEY